MFDIAYFKLNHDLQILETWLNKCTWLLKFNPSKTKDVYFSRNANHITPKLFFKSISWNVFQLGLLLSHNLSCSEYILSKAEKA